MHRLCCAKCGIGDARTAPAWGLPVSESLHNNCLVASDDFLHAFDSRLRELVLGALKGQRRRRPGA
jgi:hypothetical protein